MFKLTSIMILPSLAVSQGYLSAPSIAAVHKTDSPEEEALKVYIMTHLHM